MPDKPFYKNYPVNKILSVSAILALALLYWRELIFSKMTVFWEIMFRFMYPFILFYAESLKSLHMPLWNPYLSCGTPFFAMLQTQTLYPLNLLFVCFSFPTALSIDIITHTFLAGLFTYILIRYNGFGRKESLLASVLYMFNGFFIYHIEFIHHMSAYIWLPLIFYFFQRSLNETKIKYYILGSLALAVQFFGGYPQFSYYTFLIIGSYFILNLFKDQSNSIRLKTVLFSFFALAVFFLLTCIQTLPTFELFRLSERSGGLNYVSAMAYSLNIKEILTYFFVPVWNLFFTRVYQDAQTTGFYFGILAPIIIILSLFLRGNKNRLTAYYFVFLVLAGLLLSLGDNTPVYKFFLNYFPGMKYFRFPVQCLFFTVFGITFISAFGLKSIKSEKLKTIIFVFFVIDLFLFSAHAFNLMDNSFFSGEKPPSWLKNQPAGEDYRIMMNPLTLDKYKNYVPRDYNECLNYRDSTIPNFGMDNKLFDATGYIILRVKDYEVFYSRLLKQGFNSRLIDLINVKYMISDRVINSPKWKLFNTTGYGMNVYENTGVLPRVLFLTHEKTFNSNEEILEHISSADYQPEKEIVLLNKDSKNTGNNGNAQISITQYTPGKISLSVRNNAPGWIFMSETNYPGWDAYVDGNKSVITRADFAFRAVYLDSQATHKIEFIYSPVSFKAGALISIIAWTAAIIYLLIPLRKQTP